MESTEKEPYFVFMNYDPEYERLRAQRRTTKRGAWEIDRYLSRKHDELLAATLRPGSFKKTVSLVIVDGFAVEMTAEQASAVRAAKGVRVVEKNQEL